LLHNRIGWQEVKAGPNPRINLREAGPSDFRTTKKNPPGATKHQAGLFIPPNNDYTLPPAKKNAIRVHQSWRIREKLMLGHVASAAMVSEQMNSKVNFTFWVCPHVFQP
jgi:hypothetical protein